jgi:hypothetical protein
MVYAYNYTERAEASSWRCTNCFVHTNPDINYNILVIGVAQSAVGNSALLSTYNTATVDTYTAANALSETEYQGNLCLQGVFSTFGANIIGAWSANALSFMSGLKVVKGQNKYNGVGVFWAIQGSCRQ